MVSLSETEFFNYLSDKFNIKYTKEQMKALVEVENTILVLAAPGSGKTTVVVGRIGYLILNRGIDPKSILALTFSKAAAKDMEERYNKLFFDLINYTPRFSTIHSFAMMILREYANKKSINFTFLEDEGGKVNKKSIVKECYRNINKEFLADDKLEEILTKIGYVKNMMLKDEEIKEINTGIKNFFILYKEYEEIKRKNKYIDYDDMLYYAVNVLKKDSYMLDKYRERFKYIICDEAQDTSRIQHSILYLLGSNNMFFVADDDQSIYGFRGSYLYALNNFSKIYNNSKIYYMERNFRSGSKIVNIANKFIKINKNRYDKNIYTKNDFVDDVEVISLKTQRDQTNYVIEDIRNSSNKSIGVLFRNNLSAINIIDKLEKLNIPFFIRDKKINIFNHWILEDIKAFFTLAEDNTRIESLEKIYFKTESYISKDMIEYVKKNKRYNDSVFDVLLRCPFIEDYNEKYIINLKDSLKILRSKKPYFALDYLENSMKYLEYLNKSNKQDQGLNNYKEVISIIKNIAIDIENMEGLFKRLGVLKETIEKSKYNKDKTNITLSTIHSAKGLEYDKVYLIDLLEGILPASESVEEEKSGNISLMEEERRLFYVGMTRAKQTLKIISIEENDTRRVYSSRFVQEVYRILNPNNYDSSNYTREYDITIGDIIFHKSFGKGVVIYLEKDSIEINFVKLGIKKLLLSVCVDRGLLKVER